MLLFQGWVDTVAQAGVAGGLLILTLLTQPESVQLVEYNWSLEVSLRPCGVKISHLAVYLLDEDLVASEVLSNRSSHTFQWRYVPREAMPLGRMFCEMGQTIYHLRVFGRYADDTAFVKDLWISPYGVSYQPLRPAPRWHGSDSAPAAWWLDYIAWQESHARPANSPIANFEKLAKTPRGRPGLPVVISSRDDADVWLIGPACEELPKQ